MSFLLITISLSLGVALQARLPAMFGFRLEFLPALVAYGALTFLRGNALLLALAAGFMQDALSAGPFGLTALVYGVAALILNGLYDVLDRDLPWVQMGSGAAVAGALSVVACFSAGVTLVAPIKILLLALLSAVLTPLLFFALDYLRLAWRSS